MIMELRLYNTESRKKEKVTGPKILLYTCGPTVYDYAHIGNFRTYVFEDLLKRTLLFFGLPVKHVMNITDIDDKTIKGAISKNMALKDYTDVFKKEFFVDLKELNIMPADFYPEATAYIDEMIKIIEKLLKEEYAYRGSDGSIYFSLAKFPKYGRLSHLKLEELKMGASQRLSDEYDKENAGDFVLWKNYDEKRDGAFFWQSPFGPGRPGWHIECSAMSLKLLGDTIDIHCGGVDNIFPHHENEIAQSEAYTGKKFVKIWAHSAFLIVDGRKMSKSLGNFYTLRDLLKKGFSGREVRYMLLNSHYRTPLNFTLEGLEASKVTLRRIDDFVFRLANIETKASYGEEKILEEKAKDKFYLALADDLNISIALAALFDFMKEINILCDNQKIGAEEAGRVISFLKELDQVLGILLPEAKQQISKEVEDAVAQREKAREEKNWRLADEMRDYILKMGYIVEDTLNGPRLKKR